MEATIVVLYHIHVIFAREVVIKTFKTFTLHHLG